VVRALFFYNAVHWNLMLLKLLCQLFQFGLVGSTQRDGVGAGHNYATSTFARSMDDLRKRKANWNICSNDTVVSYRVVCRGRLTVNGKS
jgi:hypothetical protein